MTNRDFILGIIKLYQKARKVNVPSNKIHRGRSRSVSSEAEDLFAFFLSKKIKCDSLYVDQPISVAGYKSQFYPDIVIVKNNIITTFCDLKMDLGWKRDELSSLAKRQSIFLKNIRGMECKVINGVTKEEKKFKISRNISYYFIIISDRNINKKLLKQHQDSINKLGNRIKLFILTSGQSLNAYGYTPSNLIKEIEINESSFESLLKSVRSLNRVGG